MHKLYGFLYGLLLWENAGNNMGNDMGNNPKIYDFLSKKDTYVLLFNNIIK